MSRKYRAGIFLLLYEGNLGPKNVKDSSGLSCPIELPQWRLDYSLGKYIIPHLVKGSGSFMHIYVWKKKSSFFKQMWCGRCKDKFIQLPVSFVSHSSSAALMIQAFCFLSFWKFGNHVWWYILVISPSCPLQPPPSSISLSSKFISFVITHWIHLVLTLCTWE